MDDTYIKTNTYIKTKIKCCCGKVFNVKPIAILSGNTKSCGHCNDPNIGDRFGKLVVTKVIPKSHGCRIECISSNRIKDTNSRYLSRTLGYGCTASNNLFPRLFSLGYA